MVQSLNGIWKIQTDESEIGDEQEWWWTGYNDNDWSTIQVPGHWQDQSFPNYNGVVWYRLLFDLDDSFKNEFGPRTLLRFDGVFYYCQIWLNNEYLGEHEGYFDSFEFDVSDLLDTNNNLLCVKVVCYDEPNLNKKRQITGVFSHWDASDPNFNPGGIWNNVSLIKKPVLYLKELSIRTKIIDLESQTGKILLKFNVDSLITSDIKLNFVIKPKNFEGEILNDTHLLSVSPGNNLIEKKITIYNAKFWWTHDHGYPFLYDLDIIANLNGRDIDVLSTFFGIKEIKLIKNNGWQVFLNDKRIFIKGSNYAPQKHRIAESTREDYEQDVDLMVNANFNMIRIHAHIDRKELHEIASEKGILIWQDFPLQWYYNKTVLKSAKDQTKHIVNQLKNYPSQGIWCCHNEPFKIPTKNEIIKLLSLIICSIFFYIGLNFLFNLYLSLPITISKICSIIITLTIFIGISLIFDLIPTVLFYNWNINILDKKIADLISKLDPDHPVLKASGLLGRTDLHWYDGWYFNPGKYWKANKFSKKFLKCFTPFVTEYGAQSFPNVESLEKFKINLKWPFNEETWLNLKKNFRCQSNIVKKIFKINSFKTLDDFIHATQQYQSYLLKFHNELWRKLRYNPTGGAICFLFNDCAPLITWSVIDYFRKPKLAYESVSLSFEPLYALLSKWPRKFKKNSLFKNSILLINDYLHDVHDINIKFVVKSPTNTILENNYDCNIKADSIIQIDQLKFIIPNEIGEYTLDIYLSSENNSILNSYKFIVN